MDLLLGYVSDFLNRYILSFFAGLQKFFQTWQANPVEDYKYYQRHHINCTNATPDTLVVHINGKPNASITTLYPKPKCDNSEPNTALLTIIILFMTFLMALLLKKLRESYYLGRHVSFMNL